jgi:hypothetical protein
MESRAGETPPLHRSYNEASSLSAIRDRYTRLRPILEEQVKLLQQDVETRVILRSFYQNGYKDWHLLSAIYNVRLNWEAERMGVSFMEPPPKEQMEQLAEIITLSTERPARFASERLIENALHIFDATTLRTYGFDCRRQDYRFEAIQTFLRLRLKQYDLDFPHQPLFGKPPGTWPDLDARRTNHI